MKYSIIPLYLLLLFSCTQSGPSQKEFNDLRDRVIRQSDSIADAYADIKDLQEEQTFQYKDIDSTKKALVWLGNQSLKADSIGKRKEQRAKNWGIFVRTLLGR